MLGADIHQNQVYRAAYAEQLSRGCASDEEGFELYVSRETLKNRFEPRHIKPRICAISMHL
jgi:hypothetical protein